MLYPALVYNSNNYFAGLLWLHGYAYEFDFEQWLTGLNRTVGP